jgi:hypothetical protein
MNLGGCCCILFLDLDILYGLLWIFYLQKEADLTEKRILIIGVLDKEGSTNIEMAEGFCSLGHSVEAYNYRTVEERLGTEPMWLDFMASLSGKKYDLIVFCKTNSMHPRLLCEAKEYGPTWYWFMDNFEVCRQIHAASYAANATFTSATASDVAERFKLVNNRAHHIFEGYNPKLYFKEDLRKIHEFLFIGNATIPRIIKIQDLIRSGMEISIFGSGWPVGMQVNGPVFGEDERTEINQAKVVINLCHDDTIFSDRITKALACGANVMSDNCKDLREMATWFVDNPAQQADILASEAEWIYVVNNNTCQITPMKNSLVIHTRGKEGHMRHHHSWEAVCASMMEKVRVHESTIR